MIINKDTKLFFSIAQKPGNFGATLYNTAFQELGINAIYKPLKPGIVDQIDFNIFVGEMHNIGVSGISVSMPFKRNAYEYAKKVCDYEGPHNTNTLVLGEEYACAGYNTDWIGFANACMPLLRTAKTAVIYGNGAVSESIGYALQKHDIKYCLVSARLFEGHLAPKADWLINATPIGMDGIEDNVFTEEVVDRYKYVFDCVVKKDTNLIKTAVKLGKQVVTGPQMCLEQLCDQFKIYTEVDPPKDLFRKVMKENGYV